jgi:cholesterol transport system auxiliary component
VSSRMNPRTLSLRRQDVSPETRARRTAGWVVAAVLALTLGGCGGGSALDTYDLSPTAAHGPSALRGQIAIREPTASLDIDGQRIVIRTGPDTLAYLSGAQWSDRLPVLVQTRLLQTFQNAGLLKWVSRSSDGVAADYVLEMDIRAFEIDVARHSAVVDVAAKIVASRSGRVTAAKIVRVEAPAASTGGAPAAASLNEALAGAMRQIVAFVSAQI